MPKQTFQWNAGIISIPVPDNRPDGFPATVEIDLGMQTHTHGEDVPSLAEVKAAAKAELLSNWINHPGLVVTRLDGVTEIRLSIQAEDTSFNQGALVAAELAGSATVRIRDFNRTGHSLPLAEAQTLAGTVTAQVEALWVKYDAAKAAIEAAVDEAAVAAVDITI